MLKPPTTPSIVFFQTNGEECAREFLDDYDKILTFSTRVKEIVELKRIVETATGYNYNLDESVCFVISGNSINHFSPI